MHQHDRNRRGTDKRSKLRPKKICAKTEPLTSRELNRADAARIGIYIAKSHQALLTPSIAEETVRVRSRLDNPATLYGRWWHRLLQQLPWSDERAWDETLNATLHQAPDRERAEKEWQLFRAYISRKEDFRKRFPNGQLQTRAEVPFLLKVKPSLALEGVIDLLAHRSRKRSALDHRLENESHHARRS